MSRRTYIATLLLSLVLIFAVGVDANVDFLDGKSFSVMKIYSTGGTGGPYTWSFNNGVFYQDGDSGQYWILGSNTFLGTYHWSGTEEHWFIGKLKTNGSIAGVGKSITNDYTWLFGGSPGSAGDAAPAPRRGAGSEAQAAR